jgi:hypothetical protein
MSAAFSSVCPNWNSYRSSCFNFILYWREWLHQSRSRILMDCRTDPIISLPALPLLYRHFSTSIPGLLVPELQAWGSSTQARTVEWGYRPSPPNKSSPHLLYKIFGRLSCRLVTPVSRVGQLSNSRSFMEVKIYIWESLDISVDIVTRLWARRP